MDPSDELQRVHFHSPASLVERLDAIAEVYDTNRSALLVEALCEYLDETADSDPFQELVATKYYDDQLDFETVTQLVGAETAQRFRLLKADLKDEPLDLAAPDDVDEDVFRYMEGDTRCRSDRLCRLIEDNEVELSVEFRGTAVRGRNDIWPAGDVVIPALDIAV